MLTATQTITPTLNWNFTQTYATYTTPKGTTEVLECDGDLYVEFTLDVVVERPDEVTWSESVLIENIVVFNHEYNTVTFDPRGVEAFIKSCLIIES